MNEMAGIRPSAVTSANRTCDVLVIGGGPGGSAAAIFLAQAGLNTVLIEREIHPRFHVGESLLPGSLPILDQLGVLDKVREIGVYKAGAEFISEDGQTERVFNFSRALMGGPEHAYQVVRSAFDKMLFEHAAMNGVATMQQTEAEVLALSDTGASVRTRDGEGQEVTWKTRFLIDATGRSTVTSKMLNQKRPDPRNTSAAIYGHFGNIPRQAGDRAGNIRIHLTDPGWVWQIPLPDGVTSVGLVAPGPYLQNRDCGIDQFFHGHCARHPHLARMLDGATSLVPVRATGNFSYISDRATGQSHLKVGDAFGFLDPIFSTGVHLALCSARDAAEAVRACIADPASQARRLATYERDIRERISFVSWFVYNIHDPGFRHLMLNPRNFLGVEQAIISLLAGDFRRDPRLRWRIALFKGIRYLQSKRVRGKGTAYAG